MKFLPLIKQHRDIPGYKTTQTNISREELSRQLDLLVQKQAHKTSHQEGLMIRLCSLLSLSSG